MILGVKVGPRKGWGWGEDVGQGKNILQGKNVSLGDGKGDGVRENMFLEEETFPMEKVGARRGWG
jgi:hypothetical protein